MWYLVMSRSLPEKEQDKQRNYEIIANGSTINTALEG
jgi:hypothetical protein